MVPVYLHFIQRPCMSSHQCPVTDNLVLGLGDRFRLPEIVRGTKKCCLKWSGDQKRLPEMVRGTKNGFLKWSHPVHYGPQEHWLRLPADQKMLPEMVRRTIPLWIVCQAISGNRSLVRHFCWLILDRSYWFALSYMQVFFNGVIKKK